MTGAAEQYRERAGIEKGHVDGLEDDTEYVPAPEAEDFDSGLAAAKDTENLDVAEASDGMTDAGADVLAPADTEGEDDTEKVQSEDQVDDEDIVIDETEEDSAE